MLGHCTEILPKRNLFNEDLVLDIGICAEYQDGDKFWCHGSMLDLKEMTQRWETQDKAMIMKER